MANKVRKIVTKVHVQGFFVLPHSLNPSYLDSSDFFTNKVDADEVAAQYLEDYNQIFVVVPGEMVVDLYQ